MQYGLRRGKSGSCDPFLAGCGCEALRDMRDARDARAEPRIWVRFARTRVEVNLRQLASTEVNLRQPSRAEPAPKCTQMCHGGFVLHFACGEGIPAHLGTLRHIL